MSEAPVCIPRSYLIANLAAMLGQQNGGLTYLELGTAANETLGMVAGVCPQARCIGVDTRAVDPGLPNVTMYTMSTLEYLTQFAKDDAPFHLAYIDADHAFESVVMDFCTLYPFMADQSLILLDDTWPGSKEATDHGYSGTAYLMAHWLSVGGYEHVTIPASPGLTIVRKKERHLPWA